MGATWRGAVSETAPFGWTEFWLNRYQTALTILAAIFIAKQQIDAARKQHNLNVRLSFEESLTALGKVRRYCGSYTRFDLDDYIQMGDDVDHHGPLFRDISDVDLEYIKSKLDSTFYVILKRIKEELDSIYIGFDNNEDIKTLRDRYNSVSDEAAHLVQLVNEAERNISHFWS